MATSTTATPKQQFLVSNEREHATTMRVLCAYPTDKLDLRPHPKCKTARELAWMFVLERSLGTRLMNNEFAKGVPSGTPPAPPESWQEILDALEKAHKEYADLVTSIPDEKMSEPVKFFTAPKTLGDIPRIDILWFLLADQIHHRGQFSVYLRMADAKVPSIYGPSADEKWF
jgi:uncharacterized damage-inducible protein DinB